MFRLLVVSFFLSWAFILIKSGVFSYYCFSGLILSIIAQLCTCFATRTKKRTREIGQEVRVQTDIAGNFNNRNHTTNCLSSCDLTLAQREAELRGHVEALGVQQISIVNTTNRRYEANFPPSYEDSMINRPVESREIGDNLGVQENEVDCLVHRSNVSGCPPSYELAISNRTPLPDDDVKVQQVVTVTANNHYQPTYFPPSYIFTISHRLANVSKIREEMGQIGWWAALRNPTQTSTFSHTSENGDTSSTPHSQTNHLALEALQTTISIESRSSHRTTDTNRNKITGNQECHDLPTYREAIDMAAYNEKNS